MKATARLKTSRDQTADVDLSDAVRALLDHVAAELAAEYVRLMEVAATAEKPMRANDAEEGEGA